MDRKRSFEEYKDETHLGEAPDGRADYYSKIHKTSYDPVSGPLNYDEEADFEPDAEEVELDNGEWEFVHHNNRRRRKKIPSKESELYPAITYSYHARLQRYLTVADLRDLINYLLIEAKAPTWVAVRRRGAIRKVVTVMIPGLELGMFNGQIQLDKTELRSQDAYKIQLSPSQDPENGASTGKSSPSTVTNGNRESADKEQDSPDDYYPLKLDPTTLPAAVKSFGEVFSHVWPIRASTDDRLSKVFSTIFGILTAPNERSKEERNMKGPKPVRRDRFEDKRTPITEYVATIEDLQENEYPLHPALGSTDSAKEVLLASRKRYHQAVEDGWVDSLVDRLEDGEVPDKEIESGCVSVGRKVLAIDCEMVKTAENPLTLARVSIVDWDGTVVLDELVKPEQPIIDYLTAYSGITEAMLEPVTTTIGDIQRQLLEIVTPQTILIGHSLESDLKALKFAHPFIIDTALQYPHPRGPPLKLGLAFLAEKYLQKKLKRERVNGGHDSVEDARAALELIKLKCYKGPTFGTSEGSGESIFKRLRRTPRLKAAKDDIDAEEFKAGAVIDWGDPARGHGAAANVVVTCESDAEVVEGIRRAVNTRRTDAASEGDYSSAASVDFVWGRMRELEAIRGWWSSSRAGDTDGPREKVFTRYSTTDPAKDPSAPSPETLTKAVQHVAQHVADIYAALPPCTAFIVYSGMGDMKEVNRLGGIQRQFRKEYATKKWDNLTVRWTDDESQALRNAVKQAREGVGFVVVK